MLQRTITAVIFAAAMLGGVFGGKHTFFALFALITAGSLWELYGLLFATEKHLLLRRIAGSAFGLAPYLLIGGIALNITSHGALMLAGIALIFFSAAVFMLLELFLNPEKPFVYVGYYLLGMCYITLPFTLLTFLSQNEGVFFFTGGYEPWRVFGLLLLVWTNDSFAYILGSRLGKHKLFERVSPKKTWEGFIGGGVMAMLAAWGFAQVLDEYTTPQWLALAFVAVVFGTLGDLVESMFKRSLGIKDSGNLLPGHGGLLDRFDAFMFAIPFYWLALTLTS
ncbi:MAG: phosphatidate cytidylyltransferase [Saprospiraceae bacterium]|nr:phosphatidate cytidylyltransferase [Saprospiraceae bacterium]